MILWQVPLASAGLGGVAATESRVIISDRELNDTVDVWKCFDDAGKPLWSHRNVAPGMLDYGNSPRATPVIQGGRVYLFGAFGHLTCVKLDDGEVVWETNIIDEYEPDPLKWGLCGTPLLHEGKVIVNPGAKDASFVALDAKTGKQLWKSPGKPAGYGSMIAMNVNGSMQIVGHDAVSLGGWHPNTGERLWSLVPDRPNDFNVPTPIALDNQLLVSTENNGTRLFGFDGKGRIMPKPLAVHRKLAPDTHTPVVAAGRVFGVWRRLYCLDLRNGLKELWNHDRPAFTKHATLVTDGDRVLAVALTGEILLFDAKADDFHELGRIPPVAGESGLYSHLAITGSALYLRTTSRLLAMKWS